MLLVGQLVLLGVGDRVAAHAAAGQMVSQIQKSQHLPNAPTVSIKGVPFLTQVAGGRYRDIELGVRRIAVPTLCVDDIKVHLQGVHVPLRRAVANKLTTIPIDRAVGTVRITYPDLNTFLATRPGHLRVTPAGSALRLSAPIDVPLLGSVTAFGDLRASVTDNRLTLAPAGLGAEGLGSLRFPTGAVGALTTTVPLTGLPMNLRLTAARTTPDAIEITAVASHLTLDTAQAGPTLHGC